VWRADGKELVYVAGDGSVVAVDVSATPQLQVGTAKRLFQSPMRNFPRLQMSRDGTRFLVNGAVAEGGSGAITIVLNWQAALRP
jgi:hypothetical protein